MAIVRRSFKVAALVSLIGIALVPNSVAGVISNGLIGYWAGDGNANDSSSTGNHGTFTGSYVPGVFGEAFDLSTAKVSIPDNGAYSFGPDFSVGFWFNLNGVGTAGGVSFLGQDVGGGTNPKWMVNYNYQQANSFELHVNGSGSAFMESASAAAPAGWNQLTVVKAGSNYGFYLNGTSIGTVSDPTVFPDPNAPLMFGFSEPTLSFNGLMDEVVLYNRALSASEVGTLSGTGVPEPGTLLLTIAGLVSVALLRRRRK